MMNGDRAEGLPCKWFLDPQLAAAAPEAIVEAFKSSNEHYTDDDLSVGDVRRGCLSAGDHTVQIEGFVEGSEGARRKMLDMLVDVAAGRDDLCFVYAADDDEGDDEGDDGDGDAAPPKKRARVDGEQPP